MAMVMNRHGSQHVAFARNSTQKICIGIGIVFIMAGLLGIVMPGMMGLHLSNAHNVIHLVSGALSLWSGYADDSKKAYNFSLGFGSVYGLLGLAGFVFGEAGYPGVGHMAGDENLLRIIPNVLEFGTNDHTLHIILATVLLASAYAWKKNRDNASKIVVNTQARTTRVKDPLNPYGTTVSTDVSNSDSDLKDASLGRSDNNRRSDRERRSEFERRI